MMVAELAFHLPERSVEHQSWPVAVIRFCCAGRGENISSDEAAPDAGFGRVGGCRRRQGRVRA